jgi:ABC-type multidrug transport system permease subunit
MAKLNTKRWLLAALAVFVVYELANMLIHGPLLMSRYEATAAIWRPEMMDMMWIMHILYAIFALFFAFIYTKGYEDRGWMEGLRYGLLMGLLIQPLAVFSQYVIYPVPLDMAVLWFAYGMIQFLLIGLVVGAVYKK